MHRFPGLVRSSSRSLPALLGLCLTVYFAYPAFQGPNSIAALAALDMRIAAAEAELAAARAEEARLAHRVSLLQPDSLDRDMLDEQARRMLNLAHPRDVLILPEAEPALPPDR